MGAAHLIKHIKETLRTKSISYDLPEIGLGFLLATISQEGYSKARKKDFNSRLSQLNAVRKSNLSSA